MFFFKNNLLLGLGIFLLGICSCNKKDITVVELSWEIPMLDTKTGNTDFYKDKNSIYFKEDIVAYEKKDLFIDKNNIPKNIFSYWLYNIKDQKGLMFKDLSDATSGIKFDVDSMQRQNMFKDISSSDLLENGLYILLKTTRKKDEKNFVEKYAITASKDESYPDTLILQYDADLLNIPFSFSPELDKVKKSKLLSIQSIFNPVSIKGMESLAKRREMIIQIKRKQKTDADLETIDKLMKRFKDEINN